MPNSIDFRADQIQTKQIIVTGSGAGTTKLLIYGIEAQGSPVNEGLINTTYFPQDGIGGDVFLYVSGAVNAKGSATVRGTSVFGGDLVVSGSLYNGAVFGTGIAGDFSHAEGKETRAQGHYSHAEGTGSVTNANYSHAEGSGSLASGTGAHAEGFSTRASGYGSHAEGRFTNTDGGYYAHAEGYLTTGSGEASHAEGISTTAIGNHSHAEGSGSIASGGASHAEGQLTLANGIYAHAEGYLTTASAYASHAEGQNTTAGSGGSHAEGFYTSTGGDYSHTEGYQTQTTGAYSHAQGSGSITWGIYSFAAGNRTIASGSVDVTQAAFGRFNKRNNTTSLFVVGNGTGDSDALRGDIFRAESTGQLVLSGGISHKVKSIYYTPISFPLPANDTYNLTLNDYLVIVNVTDGGPFDINLPAAATTPIGTTYVIRRLDSNGSPINVVRIKTEAAVQIIATNTSYLPGNMPITGVGGTKYGGCVTLTYIGNYTDTNYATYPTWITTSELDL